MIKMKKNERLEVGVKAEWNAPKIILMHTPGDEVFYGVLHPESAIFEEAFDSLEAAKEHKNYIATLEKDGAKVVFGGHRATFLAEKILKNRKYVDAVVAYDGELAFYQYIQGREQ